MTDIVVDFMERLRVEYPETPVVSAHLANGKTNIMGVAIQKWVQRPEGCEVTLNVTYNPGTDAPMPSMLKWLNQFYTLIQKTDPYDHFTQWWGQTAQFSTEPLSVSCSVLLRYGKEVI